MTFEEKLKKLEDLTQTVKNGGTSLEDALQAFEEGMKTARELEKEIEKIEGKVQILMNSPVLPEDSEKSENASDEKSAKKSRRAKAKKAAPAEVPTPENNSSDDDTIYDTSSLEFDLFDSPELKD